MLGFFFLGFCGSATTAQGAASINSSIQIPNTSCNNLFMAGETTDPKITRVSESEGEEEEEEEEIEGWDDWRSGDGEDGEWDPLASIVCLFCAEKFDSSELLFKHCTLEHSFDFYAIVKILKLDFYGSLKLINYIRSKVVFCSQVLL